MRLKEPVKRTCCFFQLIALFEGKEIIYRLDPECPGLFVMINNVTFDDTNYLSKRDGAEKDKECLQNLFECMKRVLRSKGSKDEQRTKSNG